VKPPDEADVSLAALARRLSRSVGPGRSRVGTIDN
jgi:hypothetical protein